MNEKTTDEMKILEQYKIITGMIEKSSPQVVLACVHFLRILLFNVNRLPGDVMDQPNVQNLDQYITLLNEYTDTLDFDGEGFNLDSILFSAASIWKHTILGITDPEYFKEPALNMWQALMKGSDNAYDEFCRNFDHPRLITLESKPLLDALEDDIKRIPAALLD